MACYIPLNTLKGTFAGLSSTSAAPRLRTSFDVTPEGKRIRERRGRKDIEEEQGRREREEAKRKEVGKKKM